MRLTITGLLALLLCGGCAGSRSPSGAATPTPGEWKTYGAQVVGVKPGPDANSVLVEVAIYGGPPDCVRNLRVNNYSEEGDRIFADFIYDSRRAEISGGCTEQGKETTTLTSPKPIGDRTLGFGFDGTWVRDGDGFRRCHQSLGCRPPKDPCDPNWARAVRDSLDVPRNSSYNVDHCDPQWMVISVNLNSTACGAAPRPDCKPEPRLYQYFLRWKENGWREAAVGTCPADLPKSICDKVKPR